MAVCTAQQTQVREGSWCGSIRAAGGMAGSLESCQKLMYMLVHVYIHSALTTVMCEVSEWADVYMCTCTYNLQLHKYRGSGISVPCDIVSFFYHLLTSFIISIEDCTCLFMLLYVPLLPPFLL